MRHAMHAIPMGERELYQLALAEFRDGKDFVIERNIHHVAAMMFGKFPGEVPGHCYAELHRKKWPHFANPVRHSTCGPRPALRGTSSGTRSRNPRCRFQAPATSSRLPARVLNIVRSGRDLFPSGRKASFLPGPTCRESFSRPGTKVSAPSAARRVGFRSSTG